jgi:hypothetical protein
MDKEQEESKMRQVIFLKDDCGMTTREVAEQLGEPKSTVHHWYTEGKRRKLHIKESVVPMDDCPVKDCTGMVIAIEGHKFRCTMGHVAFYKKGEITFPEPPKPKSKKGFHRASRM